MSVHKITGIRIVWGKNQRGIPQNLGAEIYEAVECTKCHESVMVQYKAEPNKKVDPNEFLRELRKLPPISLRVA